jgi:hypothetical protein
LGQLGAGFSRDDMPKEILRNTSQLLPATFDPCDQLGPLITHFMWKASHRPVTALPCSTPTRLLRVSPATNQLTALTHPRSWPSHLPSHWASQFHGHNLMVSLALHLQICLCLVDTVSASHVLPMTTSLGSLTFTRFPAFRLVPTSWILVYFHTIPNNSTQLNSDIHKVLRTE